MTDTTATPPASGSGVARPGLAPCRSAVRGAVPIPRWKRWCDCAIAGPLLLLTFPIMLAAMALVKLTSPGPAIYSQTRLGLNRQRFILYKIRTMGHNCEAKTGACWSPGRRDPRVTFIGRILRSTHIDELPQLWNILRGEMTLVGPRPERPEIVEKLEPFIPNYGERLAVVPGLTGLAQVQLPPDVDLDSVRKKLRYDVYYAENQGLWLDLRLMLTTAGKVIGVHRFVRTLLRIPGPRQVEASAETAVISFVVQASVETAELPFVAEPSSATPQPDLSGA